MSSDANPVAYDVHQISYGLETSRRRGLKTVMGYRNSYKQGLQKSPIYLSLCRSYNRNGATESAQTHVNEFNSGQ